MQFYRITSTRKVYPQLLRSLTLSGMKSVVPDQVKQQTLWKTN